jgi:cytochrome c peroxidase
MRQKTFLLLEFFCCFIQLFAQRDTAYYNNKYKWEVGLNVTSVITNFVGNKSEDVLSPGSYQLYAKAIVNSNTGSDRVYADPGHGDGRFRIPSLRNIELTAPYMHDGRFQNLKEVVNHYNNKIEAHEKLDVKFRGSDGNSICLSLADNEVDGLVAFLKTLTDKSLVEDTTFSDPFPKE